MEEPGDFVEDASSHVRVDSLATVVHADNMEGTLLDRGWRMGGLDTSKVAKGVNIFSPSWYRRDEFSNTGYPYVKGGCSLCHRQSHIKCATQHHAVIQADVRLFLTAAIGADCNQEILWLLNK